MARFLGIDYGNRRIGLALSDAGGSLASPLTTIEPGVSLSDRVSAVVSYINKHEIDALVVGLPLNMDDTEGHQAKITRRFGDELGRRTGKPVHYWDERLSSFAAEELLRPAELSSKKRKAVRDAVAAQVILQGFLDVRSEDHDCGEDRSTSR